MARQRGRWRPHERRGAVRDPAAGNLTAIREAWLKEARELVHGTCVALGRRGALLRGRPGSGKSDLALRFLALAGEGDSSRRWWPTIRCWSKLAPTGCWPRHPEPLPGKIEVRGLGILAVPYLAQAELVLVFDLVNDEDVPRMPPEPWDRTEIAGRPVPALKLAPFEPSAPLKLKMALLLAAPTIPIKARIGLAHGTAPDKDSGLWPGGQFQRQHDRRRHRHSWQACP